MVESFDDIIMANNGGHNAHVRIYARDAGVYSAREAKCGVKSETNLHFFTPGNFGELR